MELGWGAEEEGSGERVTREMRKPNISRRLPTRRLRVHRFLQGALVSNRVLKL